MRGGNIDAGVKFTLKLHDLMGVNMRRFKVKGAGLLFLHGPSDEGDGSGKRKLEESASRKASEEELWKEMAWCIGSVFAQNPRAEQPRLSLHETHSTAYSSLSN